MKKYLLWFLVFLFLLCGVVTYAKKDAAVLVGMGNSISAATFSVSSKGMPRDPKHSWWKSLILKLVSFESRSYIKHLEKMLEADTSIVDDWDSHNLAIPGHDLADVIRVQLPKAIALRPDVVYIETFANDICADDLSGMTPTSEYFLNMQYLVNKLLNDTEAVVILVASPDLSGQPDARGGDKMWWPLNWIVGTYADLWQKVGLCRTITSGQFRQEIRYQMQMYNAIMEGLSIVHHDRVCYTYGSEMIGVRREWVSKVDGFHYSKEGQKAFAEATYFLSGTCTPPGQ